MAAVASRVLVSGLTKVCEVFRSSRGHGQGCRLQMATTQTQIESVDGDQRGEVYILCTAYMQGGMCGQAFRMSHNSAARLGGSIVRVIAWEP